MINLLGKCTCLLLQVTIGCFILVGDSALQSGGITRASESESESNTINAGLMLSIETVVVLPFISTIKVLSFLLITL